MSTGGKNMEIVENLAKATLGEIEKVLSTRTVVGEPINVDGITLIPLISIGFGFAAGGVQGKGEAKQKGEGNGGGTGGGAWVRPKAVIIIDKQGVRIEPVMGSTSFALEKLGECIPNMVERFMEKREERKKEG
jgi:uncharacterized spore protein YtfJ